MNNHVSPQLADCNDQQGQTACPLPGEGDIVRIITVEIVDVPVEDLPPEAEETGSIVEADAPEAEETREPDCWRTDEPEMPPAWRRSRFAFAVIACVCLLCAAAIVIVSFVVPALEPTVSVTIVPTSQEISVTRPVAIVAEQADATKEQVPGRTLPAVTMSQARTVPTTGKGHLPAQVASGTITFYNSAPYAQTIPAGILVVGKSGNEYATDQAVTIPAVQYPTLGQNSVSAHAITAGPAGNQEAGDVYGPCCLLNVSAVSSAFAGGQDGRDYQAVSQQDVDGTADTLKTSLEQSIRAALQTQVHDGEAMLDPACTTTVSSDHKAGEEAGQVTVTLDATCAATTYQTAALQNLMNQTINEQAATQVRAGYMRMGDIQVAVTGQKQDVSGMVLQVHASGTWSAQFDAARLYSLARAIAGKNRQEATRLLLRTAGVSQVENVPNRLPSDSAHIRVLVLVVPLSSTTDTAATPIPTSTGAPGR